MITYTKIPFSALVDKGDPQESQRPCRAFMFQAPQKGASVLLSLRSPCGATAPPLSGVRVKVRWVDQPASFTERGRKTNTHTKKQLHLLFTSRDSRHDYPAGRYPVM